MGFISNLEYAVRSKNKGLTGWCGGGRQRRGRRQLGLKIFLLGWGRGVRAGRVGGQSNNGDGGPIKNGELGLMAVGWLGIGRSRGGGGDVEELFEVAIITVRLYV